MVLWTKGGCWLERAVWGSLKKDPEKPGEWGWMAVVGQWMLEVLEKQVVVQRLFEVMGIRWNVVDGLWVEEVW